jgi:hypothetical protein
LGSVVPFIGQKYFSIVNVDLENQSLKHNVLCHSFICYQFVLISTNDPAGSALETISLHDESILSFTDCQVISKPLSYLQVDGNFGPFDQLNDVFGVLVSRNLDPVSWKSHLGRGHLICVSQEDQQNPSVQFKETIAPFHNRM